MQRRTGGGAVGCQGRSPTTTRRTTSGNRSTMIFLPTAMGHSYTLAQVGPSSSSSLSSPSASPASVGNYMLGIPTSGSARATIVGRLAGCLMTDVLSPLMDADEMPCGTTRLSNIRDGMEDWELVRVTLLCDALRGGVAVVRTKARKNAHKEAGTHAFADFMRT